MFLQDSGVHLKRISWIPCHVTKRKAFEA